MMIVIKEDMKHMKRRLSSDRTSENLSSGIDFILLIYFFLILDLD